MRYLKRFYHLLKSLWKDEKEEELNEARRVIKKRRDIVETFNRIQFIR